MSDLLTEMPSECLAPVIELLSTLDALGVTPASINVEWRFTDQTNPYLHCWLRYRTEFERLTAALKVKTSSRSPMKGQRLYSSEGNGPLIQCMSFAHHDDWIVA